MGGERTRVSGGAHRLITALSEAAERLLGFPVVDALGGRHLGPLLRLVIPSPLRPSWLGNQVGVEHACKALLDELIVRRVEARVVVAVERGARRDEAELARHRVQLALQARPALVHRGEVRCLAELAVDRCVFCIALGLVKVIHLARVGAARAEDGERGVGADEHRHGAAATRRTRRPLLVNSNVAAYHHGVSAIPCRRLDPRDRVEEGRRAAVARVGRSDALEVRLAAEELCEQCRLHALRLVDERLGADLDAADLVRCDAVALH